MLTRAIQREEIARALDFARQMFDENLAGGYSQEGRNEFYAFTEYQRIVDMWMQGQIFFWGAYEEKELVGVAALRRPGHLSLLFVRPEYQRRGIARQLWNQVYNFCVEALGVPVITASVAVPAVDIYYRLGFHVTGAEQVLNGMRYVPMECVVAPGDIRPQRSSTRRTVVILLILIAALIAALGSCAFFGVRSLIKHTENYEEEFVRKLPDIERDVEESATLTEEEPEEMRIEDIPVYAADDISYEVTIEEYVVSEEKDGKKFQFDILYPQIDGLKGEKESDVNGKLRSCAMQTVQDTYISPTENMKAWMKEPDMNYYASTVSCNVTYMSRDLVSVIYEDHYFLGSYAAEYCDIRTRTINLKTGETYEIQNVITQNSVVSQNWETKLREELGDSMVTGVMNREWLEKMLAGEIVDNRYYAVFLLQDGGMELGFTYHYGGEDGIARGWVLTPIGEEELSIYQSDSEIWQLMQTNN